MPDANVEPKYDVPLWNETRWNGCWNPDEGVGVYLHAGRYRADLDMWWAQVAAYLPGGQLCVERLWGRSANPAGVSIGGLELAVGDDGWTARFDGVGQLTGTQALAAAPRGSSAPSRSLRFEVDAQAATPQWDMYAATTGRLEFAGDTHVQQGYHTSGRLQVGEHEYRLDGIGFKDHSSGPRDFSTWFGHRFFLIVTAAWTCHAIVMYSPDGEPLPPWGAFFRDGQQAAITRFELPLLADAAGGPVNGEALIETDSGERLRFASELVHALPMTITLDNDNINGVDWELEGDPVVIIEGKGRLTAPDGTVAYCFHERSARRSEVRRG
jgi:hypothetical protein